MFATTSVEGVGVGAFLEIGEPFPGKGKYEGKRLAYAYVAGQKAWLIDYDDYERRQQDGERHPQFIVLHRYALR